MITPHWPRDVRSDPRQMPELRHALQYLAREGGPWQKAEDFRTYNEMVGNFKGVSMETVSIPATQIIAGPTGYGPGEMEAALRASHLRGQNSMEWYRVMLEESQLIHVAPDLCDVLFSAHDTVPVDTVLHESDPPVPSGLVVFAEPFLGIDSGTVFTEVRVDGLMWGPVALPPKDDWIMGVTSTLPGYAIAALRYMDPRHHDDPAALALRKQIESEGQDLASGHWDPAWVPLGRADWLLGDAISEPTHDGIDPEGNVHESMMEDRKLVAALWSLIKEKRMTERVTVTPNRPARRRLERAGYRGTPEVQVVHLRRPEYRPRNEDGTEGRKIGVRFAVKPHWRNQAYGPGRKLRRLILIPPHMKGPEDAPLRHAERIWSVDQ